MTTPRTPTPRPGQAPTPPRRPAPRKVSSPRPQTREQAGLLSGAVAAPGVRADTILNMAMNFVGMPYKWGGASPETSFDCSGLIQYAYGQNGVKLPRVSRDQARMGTGVAAKDAQPGDLVAFDNSPDRPGIDHIGIYLGGGKMLQAPRTGRNIEVTTVNLSRAVTIRRVLPQSAFVGLSSDGKGKYTYEATRTPGATPPTRITPATGGGDDAVPPNSGGGRTGVPGSPLGIAAAGAGSAGLGGPLPKTATPQQIKEEVARSYGYLAAFLNDREIGPILTRAAIEDWDEARLTGALTATNWWKKNSDATRQWDALNKIDPAKAKSQVAQMSATLADQADEAGLILTGLQLHDMAVNALRFGWNSAQIGDALKQQGKHDPRAKSARDVDRLAKDDPASYNKLIGDTTNDVRQAATKLGVTLDTRTAGDLAGRAVREAWDADDMARELSKLITVGKTNTGQVAVTVDGLKQQAAQYLVPLSDATLQQWTQQIMAGTQTDDTFTSYLRDQAKAMRPWMAKQIDAGITPGQQGDPYKQYAAQIHERSADEIDLMNDPKYAIALDFVDPKTGERRPMSFTEWQTHLRNMDEYKSTAQANDKAAQFALQLSEAFGKRAS